MCLEATEGLCFCLDGVPVGGGWAALREMGKEQDPRPQHSTRTGPGNMERGRRAGVPTDITLPQGNARTGWLLSV